MEFLHSKCGGLIDVGRRTCTRCSKHWNPISFAFSPTEIRPVPSSLETESRRYTTQSKWSKKVPGASTLPNLLPDWPRWARILSVVVVALLVVGLVIWLGVFV